MRTFAVGQQQIGLVLGTAGVSVRSRRAALGGGPLRQLEEEGLNVPGGHGDEDTRRGGRRRGAARSWLACRRVGRLERSREQRTTAERPLLGLRLGLCEQLVEASEPYVEAG